MRYIGVDLHKTTIVACYLNEGKFSHKSFKIEEIDKFKSSLNIDDELAFETTTNSNWFYYQCKALVSRIVVVNTSEFGAIATSVKKTDKNDAKVIAIYLSKNMLPEVMVKSIESQELQSLFNSRKLLTKQATTIKNQIHSILLGHGIIIKPVDLISNIGMKRISAIPLSQDVKLNIETLLDLLKLLKQKIKDLNKQLEDSGKKLPGFANLKSIEGIGTNTVVLLLATIGNINNFTTHNKLSAYIGLIPKVRNSNNSIKHCRITKRGNSLLRGNLVMCALSAIKTNALLNDFYMRIKTKSGHGKAIVATANRLVKIAYYTLKYNWLFIDFGQQKREILEISW